MLSFYRSLPFINLKRCRTRTASLYLNDQMLASGKNPYCPSSWVWTRLSRCPMRSPHWPTAASPKAARSTSSPLMSSMTRRYELSRSNSYVLSLFCNYMQIWVANRDIFVSSDIHVGRDGLPNGPTGPRPRGPWAQGAPKPEPLREVAVMYLLFVVERGVFC